MIDINAASHGRPGVLCPFIAANAESLDGFRPALP
jgi:hypothetical protein